MEKAILKALIYADIFDYPLKGYEIHKWLIEKQVTLHQVEKGLMKLLKKRRVSCKKEFYFLRNKKSLVLKRLKKEKQSRKYFIKVKILSKSLQLIPWIKLVGISGGLSLNNASKVDDIDLFIITSKNRLWISRIMAVVILDLLGVRRKVGMSKAQTAGKICLNTILEEEKLEQKIKDVYIAHEVLQMKVLWQRGSIYQKYLEDNAWVFRFLPNWASGQRSEIKNKQKNSSDLKILDWLEILAKKFQLKIMNKPKGQERIEDGGLYFHPFDYRLLVLKKYKFRTKKI